MVESAIEILEGQREEVTVLAFRLGDAPDTQARERVKRVRRMERKSRIGMRFDPDDIATSTEDALQGYIDLLQAFKHIYVGFDDAPARAQIDRVVEIIFELKKEREFLRRINDNPKNKPSFAFYEKKERDSYPYSAKIREYVDDKFSELEREGEVFMLGGYRGHHVIVRLTKEKTLEGGYQYYSTVYNAGSEAIAAPGYDKSEKVMGVLKTKIRGNEVGDVQEFIRTTVEKNLRNPRKHAEAYLNLAGQFKRGIELMDSQDQILVSQISYRAEDPQHKRNCTTRSTRQMVEDLLDHNLFRVFHKNFVRNRLKLSVKKIIQKLKEAEDELNALIDKTKGEAKFSTELREFIEATWVEHETVELPVPDILKREAEPDVGPEICVDNIIQVFLDDGVLISPKAQEQVQEAVFAYYVRNELSLRGRLIEQIDRATRGLKEEGTFLTDESLRKKMMFSRRAMALAMIPEPKGGPGPDSCILEIGGRLGDLVDEGDLVVIDNAVEAEYFRYEQSCRNTFTSAMAAFLKENRGVEESTHREVYDDGVEEFRLIEKFTGSIAAEVQAFLSKKLGGKGR